MFPGCGDLQDVGPYTASSMASARCWLARAPGTHPACGRLPRCCQVRGDLRGRSVHRLEAGQSPFRGRAVGRQLPNVNWTPPRLVWCGRPRMVRSVHPSSMLVPRCWLAGRPELTQPHGMLPRLPTCGRPHMVVRTTALGKRKKKVQARSTAAAGGRYFATPWRRPQVGPGCGRTSGWSGPYPPPRWHCPLLDWRGRPAAHPGSPLRCLPRVPRVAGYHMWPAYSPLDGQGPFEAARRPQLTQLALAEPQGWQGRATAGMVGSIHRLLKVPGPPLDDAAWTHPPRLACTAEPTQKGGPRWPVAVLKSSTVGDGNHVRGNSARAAEGGRLPRALGNSQPTAASGVPPSPACSARTRARPGPADNPPPPPPPPPPLRWRGQCEVVAVIWATRRWKRRTRSSRPGSPGLSGSALDRLLPPGRPLAA